MSKSKLPAAANLPEYAYVGFGSNIGDGEQMFAQTLVHFNARSILVCRCSSLYESEPWGGAEGGNFLNAVIEIEKNGTPMHFLKVLLEIEAALGRIRERAIAARTCDLDLLLWGGECIHSDELRVPHPRLAKRNFVLIPLNELVPDKTHPVLNQTFSELLSLSKDTCKVWKHLPQQIPQCP
jgi:2-amino-4-hydroxy-6-hydroxymethyldihydropteridine diphosphokinase